MCPNYPSGRDFISPLAAMTSPVRYRPCWGDVDDMRETRRRKPALLSLTGRSQAFNDLDGVTRHY